MRSDLPTGTVTFLFSDIEGSTRLLTDLGAAYTGLLSRHHAIWRAAIAAHDGVEVKTEGDAFFVAFRRAPAAVACASDAQRALSAEGWPGGRSVRVRVGIHTGEGDLSESDYVGLDVHRAARIAAAAHGGQVLLSAAARALVAHALPVGVTLRDLGEHRLKDLTEPVALYQLEIVGLPADFPPLRALGRGNLPEQLTSFVGREREIGEVTDLLRHSRLLTLTGPGGTGKTRLSLEVARLAEGGFADGAWFVPLDTVTDPALVLPAIGRALGVREEGGRPMGDALVDTIRERHMLLVLDNLEQVVAAAPAIASLLSGAPAPRVLCSSREALRVTGEQEYPVPPLAPEPATSLFIERARQVRPGFAPDESELAAIRSICAALDDLPLAIELAAARTRLFAVPALLERLSDRLATLQSGARDLPERQRTLRGAIDWSYELLEPIEREVFARLAVFVGSFALEAAEAIVDPRGELGQDVLGALGSLIDKSLLRAEEGRGTEPRFVMLETIRAYAAERLAGATVEGDLRGRHLAYYLARGETFEPMFTGRDADRTLNNALADNDNFRAAIEWALAGGDLAAGLLIGGALWRYWQQRGRLSEGRQLLEQLLGSPHSADHPAARARALSGYGGVVYWQGEHELARSVYVEALGLYRAEGDEPRVALALFDLAFTVAIAREVDAATALLDEASAIYRRLGDERGWLMIEQGKAAVGMIAGDLPRARDAAAGLVPEYRRLGMTFQVADTLGLLTAIEVQLGNVEGARRALQEAGEVFMEVGDVSSFAAMLQFAGSVALLDGRPADAARLAGALQAKRDRGGAFLTPAEIINLPDPEHGAREALPPDEFEAAYAEGRQWSREQALDFAMNSAGPAAER